jgi:hypothetical protein
VRCACLNLKHKNALLHTFIIFYHRLFPSPGVKRLGREADLSPTSSVGAWHTSLQRSAQLRTGTTLMLYRDQWRICSVWLAFKTCCINWSRYSYAWHYNISTDCSSSGPGFNPRALWCKMWISWSLVAQVEVFVSLLVTIVMTACTHTVAQVEVFVSLLVTIVTTACTHIVAQVDRRLC